MGIIQHCYAFGFFETCLATTYWSINPTKWGLQSTTVCPKVARISFHMVFSAISGWILKPFDLQVATMCGFDIMYDKPVLPSKVPPCKWITFRHDLEKIRFLDNPTSTVWLSCSCTLARLTEFWDVPPSCWCSSSSSARVTA